jgi:hypothetical protein
MKLREVVFVLQGTSFVLNFTQPDSVCITVFEFGVGTWGTLRTGGVNTEDIRSPTKNPANSQRIENILYCYLCRFKE